MLGCGAIGGYGALGASDALAAARPPLSTGMSPYDVVERWGPPVTTEEHEVAREVLWHYQEAVLRFVNGRLQAPPQPAHPANDSRKPASAERPTQSGHRGSSGSVGPSGSGAGSEQSRGFFDTDTPPPTKKILKELMEYYPPDNKPLDGGPGGGLGAGPGAPPLSPPGFNMNPLAPNPAFGGPDLHGSHITGELE